MADLSPQLRTRLAESVAELVRIPSVNPLHAGPRAGVADEKRIARHLAVRFAALGAVEVVLDEVVDDRANVYGIFAGRSERVVVLDVHTDTVTVEHMTDADPFDGRIQDGCVWGRGALDTKATMGVILTLLEDWQRDGLRPEPTLIVVGSAGEEGGGLLGARRFCEWARERGLRIDQVVSAEPTQLAPVHGHKGGVGMRITTVGLAAHSARPELGRNAISAMGPVIAALDAEHERLQSLPPSTMVGVATLTVGLINGGTGSNVVPARCTITVGRRTVPGEDPDVEYARLVAIAKAASPLPIEIESLAPFPDEAKGSPAFFVPPDAPLIATLAAAAGTRPTVAPFGTNALRYCEVTDQLAVFGPGSIDDAHQATERVSIDDLERTAAVLTVWLEPG